MKLFETDPLAKAVVAAIKEGDLTALERMLIEHRGLANAVIHTRGRDGSDQGRPLLHILTDWPGHVPNGPAAADLLVRSGADVNARFEGPHRETALHWAASSDDVGVLDTLLDAGADLEADGAVIGGGTPLADAVAFGQWNAARRLIERGAKANLWQAAALGLMDRVAAHLDAEPAPSPEDLTVAFWCACHGGQLDAAVSLSERGADVNWIGFDHLTPLGAAQRSGAEEVVRWLTK